MEKKDLNRLMHVLDAAHAIVLTLRSSMQVISSFIVSFIFILGITQQSLAGMEQAREPNRSMLMKTAIVIRHVAFEDLGTWEGFLSNYYKIKYIDATDPSIPVLKNETIDLLVVLGGPIGVYQEEEYPFIKHEVALLAHRLKSDLPTLGICLGSQLMARALGAKVYPNHTKEIGWYPLSITEKGKQNYVNYLSSEYTSMFHWHGDTFDLPNGAQLLASTEVCKNQIFSWGKNGLAFQCHPEISAQHLENWWIGHAAELSHHQLSVNSLRNQSLKLASQLQKQSLRCLQEWIDSINH